MYIYIILPIIALILAIGAAVYIIWQTNFLFKLEKIITAIPMKLYLAGGVLMISGLIWIFVSLPYPLHFSMPPTMQSHAPGDVLASIPIQSIAAFFMSINNFERIDHIGTDPNAVPAPIERVDSDTVEVTLTAKEVIAEVGKGIYFNYWTYNGQVPGPMLRVKEGDIVTITLKNDSSSLHSHNIDLHAVNGPGGGSSLTMVEPGEEKSFQFKATHPGLYVYHCATPNVSTHNSHGQYGLILVEPDEGLPEVDHEFYLMQGELYTMGGLGKKGLTVFDPQAMLDGIPTYVTFNGVIEDSPRMQINTGDRVRIYVGNGGVNLISSFHVIGEIFDTVYPEASIGGEVLHNVQTTAVLPGGASIVEFTADVPGSYLVVDHALSRMNKGAWATLEVSGQARPDLFKAL